MSIGSAHQRERTECKECELPHYADGECPYCDYASTDGGRKEQRRRTTCNTCKLPYYEGVGGCPYCGRADERRESPAEQGGGEMSAGAGDAADVGTEAETRAEDEVPGAKTEEEEPAATDADEEERSPSLLTRISNRIWRVFGD